MLVTVSIAILLLVTQESNGEANADPASPQSGHAHQPSLPNPRIMEGPKDQYFAKHLPATLNCKAEGDPPPIVTWYQNGQQIVFGTESDAEHHRMVLATGQLFFLRVIHTKTNRPDVGIYFCKATNKHGSITSRNATIKIAVLRDDFRQEPVDTTKSVHSTAILHCKPPRGEPEPNISWQLNGIAIQPSNRIQVQDDGDLVISKVTVQDIGQYQCIARNEAGERKSSAAQLTVLEVPEIIRYPVDVTADEGKTIEFHCGISAGSDIKWDWKKKGGTSDKSRWRTLPDRTLRIEKVKASDMGTYICMAENAAGSVEAMAHLKVEYTPTFLVRPSDQVVSAGRTVTLQCSAIGNPVPTIFWKTKTEMSLLFTNKQSGRFSVAVDGTLRIERVEKSDEGEYSCEAINSKGESRAKAVISVRENDLRPPPVIRFGPQNQSLPVEGVALLRCQATGTPQPLIRWYKHGRPLQLTDARYTLLNSGTLQISSLKISDTGRYACKAVSETGETTVEASLLVESQTSSQPSDPIKAPPDLTLFPGAPEKPVVSDVTDTSIRLSWQQLRDTGTKPILGYQVEYFGYGSTETWEVAGDSYQGTEVVITGLVHNTTYVFLVRAKNSHGVGGPSPLSTLVRTLEKGEGHFITPVINLPRKEVEAKIKDVRVKFLKGEAVNSSAITISWEVPNEMRVVSGFIIRYKHILNMGDRQNVRLYGRTLEKPLPYRPLTYTLTGLDSYEYYEICVMASSGPSSSPCSPPMKIQTGESVPTSPPINVVIQRESDTQILLEWSPPNIQDRKGEIIAYKIKCYSEDREHNCSRSVNATTYSLRIDDLVSGVNYNILMAAQTEKGVGQWSSAYSVGPDHVDITKEAWFIGLIVAIGSVFWLGLCIFTTWLCRNHKQRKKLKEPWFTGGNRSSLKGQERNGNIVRKGYGVKDGTFQDSSDSCLPPEFSTLLQQSRQDGDDQNENMYNLARDCNHGDMKTFYQKSGPVTPYATTTLLQAQAQAQNARKQGSGSDQLFRPINQSCPQHSGGSGDSNTDNTTDVSIESRDRKRGSTGDNGNQTDETGQLLKQHRKGCRPGVPQNPAMVNWTDVLPPPPGHPPLDGEFLQDDQLYSEIPEERARSPMSPMSVSQMSGCSCPVSHGHPVSAGNMAMYSGDRCNRCHALWNFDNRPYSPQQIMQLQRQHVCPAANMSRTMGPAHLIGGQRGGGTPVYLHGYSQPWDCQPLPHAGQYEYDYAQVQEGLIDNSNTLRGRDGRDRNINTINNISNILNIQPHCGPQLGDYYQEDGSIVSNIPGGPPGNYCEGPCRSQIEALNTLNSRGRIGPDRGDPSQLPFLEGYKIESPPSSANASEYKVVGSVRDAGSSSDKKSSIKGRSSSEGSDLKGDKPYQPSLMYGGNGNCRPAIFHSRSDASPAEALIGEEGYTRNADSPISEDHEFTEDSENGGDHNNERDSMVANWESMEDCSSQHSSSSSAGSEGGGQFLNEADFASAVAQAAVMSGLTVVGTTVSDPSPKPVKKTKRHHRQVRAPSPGYSTDSNYGSADVTVHKPYPKSQRRKQLAEQGKHRKGNNSNLSKDDNSTNSTDQSKGTSPPSDSMNGEDSHPFRGPNSPTTANKPSQLPSLYKSRPTEGDAEPQQKNSTTKLGMFKFSDDIPVV